MVMTAQRLIESHANQTEEITAEYDVPYYDFNMVREEYLPIQDRQYFMNDFMIY